MTELAYTSTWTVAHPRAAELAERLAVVRPGGHQPGRSSPPVAVRRTRPCGRSPVSGTPPTASRSAPRPSPAHVAYHGTSLGALSFTGIQSMRDPFMPMPIHVRHVSETNAYRHPEGADPAAFTKALLDEIEQAIIEEGADEVAHHHRRAGAERRGLLHATRRLLAGLARALRQVRDPARQRRRHQRLRPHRRVVRRQRLRLHARHDRVRQGRDRGPVAARRCPAPRPRRRAVRLGARLLHARDHLQRAPGVLRRRPGGGRHLRAREGLRERARERAGLRADARPAALHRPGR